MTIEEMYAALVNGDITLDQFEEWVYEGRENARQSMYDVLSDIHNTAI